MNVSLNWIKEYLDFDLPPTAELVEKIGAQLGVVEKVTDLGAKYQGIVIAKVVKCEKLEGSDHLSICLLDDGGNTPDVNRGENGHIQVVCGANNVATGVIVAWLPPRTIVPSTYGTNDPFTLEARELRGTVSNGMLASAKELALGDDHDGILLLEDDAPIGADFAKHYKLDDYIIDIENKMFTHRPDGFGQLGVAREVAGILGKPFKSPEWYDSKKTVSLDVKADLPFSVQNEIPNLVSRFSAISVAKVSVKPSPIWLQTYLARVGVRPINNIVDLTNYFMLLTGQPMHAYDYDKVKAASDGDSVTLIARNPHSGEKLQLLNGKEVEPRSEAIVIATNRQAISLGGVMGGTSTEVDDSTKNIILECASFDMYSIRRTSMAHGIFSDAVTRFNKGQSPLQVVAVLSQAVQDLLLVSEGGIASKLIDDNHLDSSVLGRASLHPPVNVTAEFINTRLGLELGSAKMAALLTNVEFGVKLSDDELEVTAPFWRTDIELREDVVEEIGRLYGFDHLPLALPKRDITPARRNPMLELKSRVRSVLSKSGANEVLTYSFVDGNLLNKVGQDKALAFELSNALSPDLQYYRITLLPSLLDKVHANIKAGCDEFAIFELGKNHTLLHKDDGPDGLPQEFEELAFVYAANDKLKKPDAALYTAKYYAHVLAFKFGLELKFMPVGEFPDLPITKPYNPARSAFIIDVPSGETLGIVGEFTANTRKNLKLPVHSAGFEISLDVLLKIAMASPAYLPLPRFPKVSQDICLKVSADFLYADLNEFVATQLITTKPERSLLRVSLIDIFQRQDDTDHKQITFRIDLANHDRTMTLAELSTLLDQLAEAAKQKLQAERV